MKIALLADTFPPLRNSGAVQLRDLTREFARQGHDVTVMLPAPNLDERWKIEPFDGAQILRLRSPQTKDISYLRRTLGEWRMPYAMRRNLKKSPLANEPWDGIVWYSPSIFHAPLVRDLKASAGCKGYLIVRDIFPEWALDLGLMGPGLAYQFFKAIARQQYAAADVIGVQTTGNISYFNEWSYEHPGRTLEVLQNWLDHPTTDRSTIRVDQTNLKGRKIFVYAGNMGIAQGMDILIDLAERMQARRDIGFLFVGRGSDAKRLAELAQSKTLDNVLFHDEISPDEIPDLYAQCEAGIVALDPRHRSHNIPGKFLTYMQSRLPTLANVNAGNDLARLIRDEDVGRVCETNTLDDLEDQCRRLIEKMETDPSLADRCGCLFKREFSVSQTVAQIVAALETST